MLPNLLASVASLTLSRDESKTFYIYAESNLLMLDVRDLVKLKDLTMLLESINTNQLHAA